MFNSKNLIGAATVILLLIAIPVMAVEGTAKFVVTDTVSVAGSELKPGAYDVKWESSSSEASVVFMSQGKAVLKVQGKIEELNEKNDSNSLLIMKDPSGKPVLKGLQFSGKKIRITFFNRSVRFVLSARGLLIPAPHNRRIRVNR